MRLISSLQRAVAIDHSCQVGYARREALAEARAAGLPPEQAERVALVCTEMASNILRHAGGAGQVVIRRLSEAPGVELLALDRGPGLDAGRLMADSQSTVAGSLGTGLGAIRRLSDVFDIYVGRGVGGAALLSRVFAAPPKRDHCWTFGVVSLPLADHPVCGDGWGLAGDRGEAVLMVVDGLGHGLPAADVARQAEHLFHTAVIATPLGLIETIGAGLAGSRGAVGLVLRVVPARGIVCAAGIGNITGRILDGGGNGKRLVSYPGILGRRTRHCQQLDMPWGADSLAVVHSDGLSQKWSEADYPGLWVRHPALIAGVLYRDHATGNDDTTVAVLRCEAPP
jgi:anti-sigma regulatory factor (Ser/Thr protein kinase)